MSGMPSPFSELAPLLARIYTPEAKLLEVARARSGEYRSADPFPHIVIDGLFAPERLEAIEELSGKHSTLFRLRPGERASWKIRQIVKRFTPPIVHDARYMIFKPENAEPKDS
jgi:hypothetical protein